MSLAAGSRLGPYEILAPIGTGGMGEVYRARDPKLARDVAIKVLPDRLARDPEALARFEREARAVAALSHPHILSIFEFGSSDGIVFAVMELLDGETLRDKLAGTALPARKVVEYATQIADGLAAAHEKGIVHRDLKPDNIFVSSEGHVKILDFGLARQRLPAELQDAVSSPTLSRHTEPGTLLGTVGYMSPEQVRGVAVDHRSDIFSFGAILFEMLSGKRAFEGDSQVETMHAILKRDPLEASPIAAIPPGLERAVRHCLEKSPAERFQSARDLAFDLQAQSTLSAAHSPALAAPAPGKARSLQIVGAAALLAVGIVSGLWVGRAGRRVEPPTMKRLTFERGTVQGARFVPGSRDVLYSASWQGRPATVFQVRPDNPEARPLDVSNASLLAVSASEELALKLSSRVQNRSVVGRLARAPAGRGGMREVLDGVVAADWMPDGSQLAVVRMPDTESWQLESPPGHLLYRTDHPIELVRAAPHADGIAFSESDFGLAGGSGLQSLISVVDTSGKRRVLTTVTNCSGLAWNISTAELWLSEDDPAGHSTLWAVNADGQRRLVWRVPGWASLADLAADGRLLLNTIRFQNGLVGRAPGAERETDLAWLDGSLPEDLSNDGRTVLLTEVAAGGGERGSIYVRGTDGSPAVRLGAGGGLSLAPDGRFALGLPPDSIKRIVWLPTGAGEARQIEPAGLRGIDQAWFLADGSLVIAGRTPENAGRLWRVNKDGGELRPLTPPQWTTFIGERPISPDQSLLATTHDVETVIRIHPIDGKESWLVPGLGADDVVSGWTADSKALYVYNREGLPARVYRVDVHSGRKELWRELMPADPAGVAGVRRVLVTPDARAYVYGFPRTLSELYLVEGMH